MKKVQRVTNKGAVVEGSDEVEVAVDAVVAVCVVGIDGEMSRVSSPDGDGVGMGEACVRLD